MGNADVKEQLEVAIEEVGKLERYVTELKEMLKDRDARYVKDTDILFLARKAAERERDAALAVIAEVRALAGAGVTNQDGCWMDVEACERILAQSPADALAEHDRTVKAEALEEAAALREAEYRKATREMGFKRQFLGEWLPETPTLAEQHTTALAEQSAHYRDNPMNSDDGRDE